MQPLPSALPIVLLSIVVVVVENVVVVVVCADSLPTFEENILYILHVHVHVHIDVWATLELTAATPGSGPSAPDSAQGSTV